MDHRAQSVGIARYVLGLMVGAIMFWIIADVTDPILTRANQSTNASSANQATQWFQQGFNFWPVFVMLSSFLGLIVYAVYVREVRR